jgi:cell division protein FtsN
MIRRGPYGKLYRRKILQLTSCILLICALLVHAGAEASSREFQLFDHAYDAYLSYQPEKAVEEFRLFLQEFPDSSAKDAALFWLARSLLQIKSIGEAKKTFAYLEEQFPESPFIRYIPKQPETIDDAWEQQSSEKGSIDKEAEQKLPLAEMIMMPKGGTNKKAPYGVDITKPGEAPPGEKAQGILPSSEGKHDEKTSVYALQVGAFKTKESAVTVSKKLQKQCSTKQIMICQQGDFFKVRIIGFEDIDEVNSMLSAGFDGLVIKTNEAACGLTSQSLVSLPR